MESCIIDVQDVSLRDVLRISRKPQGLNVDLGADDGKSTWKKVDIWKAFEVRKNEHFGSRTC